MGAAKIGVTNLIDSALITATAEVSSLPVSNLLDADVVKAWNAGANAASLVADFGSAVTLNGTALMGTSLSDIATARVRVSSVDPLGEAGDVLDTGTLAAAVNPLYGTFISLFAAPATGRFLRIDLSDGATVSAGRWWAGPLVQPSINLSFGWKKGMADASQRSTTPGGQSHTNRLSQRRTYDVTFDALTDAEVESLAETLQQQVGLFGDLLFVLDPDSADLSRNSLWAQMVELDDISNPIFQRYSYEMKLIERK